ncbi:zinc transporter ZIP1 [Elysia marginata]|uniref:Zinc transporter ZIP1 n=1 Tax=Elysia marginata TaxID=1093978 RepID=A0AAV4EDU2_9GAST|nr:zinc transporter ZIP1 [Elysia marginata]
MDLILAKILTAIFLFVLTLIFSFIPYFIVVKGSRSATAIQRRQWILGHLNCFAGGVFLATFLCHILAEGGEEFEDYKTKADIDMDFPLFNVFVATGFFIVAFIELIGHKYMTSEDGNIQETQSAYAPLRAGANNAGYGATSGRDGDVTEQAAHDNDEAHVGHSHVPKPDGFRAFLLLIALSFHTIFDGLAVGLQESDSEVWAVFAAITIHKSIISFCIGLEIFQSSRDKILQAVIWLVIFAIMSPVGIVAGIGVTSGSTNELARLLISSILQGIAGGTFMYVTFLEILNLHIGHHGQRNVFHVIWALVGFAGMAATKLFDKD